MKQKIFNGVALAAVIVGLSAQGTAINSPPQFYAEWKIDASTTLQIELSTNVTATTVTVKATGKEPREMLLYETNRIVRVIKLIEGQLPSDDIINVALIGSAVGPTTPKLAPIPKRAERIVLPVQ